MNRETLKENFNKVLNNGIIKCEITIDDIPRIIVIYKCKGTDIIQFSIEGDCVVDFEDLPTDMLNKIYEQLKR